MKRFKVIVKKLGKRVTWKGMTLSTPCKFIIDEKDKTSVQVVLKRNGIDKKEYTMVEVKEQSFGISEANKAAKKQAEKSAKEVSKAVKETKAEPKKEEVKPEPKKEEVKPEPKKNNKKHR